MCGFGVQEMSKTDVITKVNGILLLVFTIFETNIRYFYLQINTQGCIQRLKGTLEQNLYIVAGIAVAVALTQLFSKINWQYLIISNDNNSCASFLVIWLARTLESQIIDQRNLWHYN